MNQLLYKKTYDIFVWLHINTISNMKKITSQMEKLHGKYDLNLIISHLCIVLYSP
jgi:hypothetical protein